MSVPGVQAFLLPLLQLAVDGQEHTHAEAVESLGNSMSLTDAERTELLPSGTQTHVANRTAWARTYLKHAGLLTSTGRGRFRITRSGVDLLNSAPTAISMKDLEKYPGSIQFRARRGTRSGLDEAAISQAAHGDSTPEESLESSYQTLRASLAAELLDRVRASSPSFFERLVVDLLVAMGYGGSRQEAGRAVGQSGDEGVDGVINEDKLGLDVVYIQAKRWQATVGRPVVQAFAGSLAGFRARKGVLITTSTFSAEARDYVSKIEVRIILVDGDELAEHMIDNGVGVSLVTQYALKRVDEDYFEDLPAPAPHPEVTA
jgi:restriction system protein